MPFRYGPALLGALEFSVQGLANHTATLPRLRVNGFPSSGYFALTELIIHLTFSKKTPPRGSECAQVARHARFRA